VNGPHAGTCGELAADGSALWDGYTSARDKELRRCYGLKLTHYQAILDAQHGVCALCGKPPTTGRALVVDHDHQTGEIRGLLHQRCNRQVSDQIARYLADPPARRVGLGPLVIPPQRLEALARRNQQRETKRQPKRRTLGPTSPASDAGPRARGDGDVAARLARALDQPAPHHRDK